MKKLLLSIIALLFSINIFSQNIDEAMQFYKKGKYYLAAQEFEQALPLAKKEFGKNDTAHYAYYITIAAFCNAKISNIETAEIYFLQSKSIYEKVSGTTDPFYYVILMKLGELYSITENYRGAIENYEIIIENIDKTNPTHRPDIYYDALLAMHSVYKKMCDYTNACYTIRKFYDKSKYDNPADREVARLVFAENLMFINEYDSALVILESRLNNKDYSVENEALYFDKLYKIAIHNNDEDLLYKTALSLTELFLNYQEPKDILRYTIGAAVVLERRGNTEYSIDLYLKAKSIAMKLQRLYVVELINEKILSIENSNQELLNTNDNFQTVVQIGHNARVSSIEFSNNGELMATTSYDKSISVWNIKSGIELFHFQGHEMAVSSCRFTPDNSNLISAGYDGSAIVWDLNSGQKIYEFNDFQSGISSISIDSTGRFLLECAENCIIRDLLDTSIIIPIIDSMNFYNYPFVESSIFDMNSNSFIIKTNKSKIIQWSIDSAKILNTWKLQDINEGLNLVITDFSNITGGAVMDEAYQNSAFDSNYNHVNILSIVSANDWYGTTTNGIDNGCNNMCILQKNNMLIAADSCIYLINLLTGDTAIQRLKKHKLVITSLSLNSDRTKLIVSSPDNISIWAIYNNTISKLIDFPNQIKYTKEWDVGEYIASAEISIPYNTVKFHPTIPNFFFRSYHNGWIELLNEDDRIVKEFKPYVSSISESSITNDSCIIAIGTNDFSENNIRLINLSDIHKSKIINTENPEIEWMADQFSYIQFLPLNNPSILFSASQKNLYNYFEPDINYLSLLYNEEIIHFRNENLISSINISSDGDYICIIGGTTYNLYSTFNFLFSDSGAPIFSKEINQIEGEIDHVAFDTYNNVLYLSGNNMINNSYFNSFGKSDSTYGTSKIISTIIATSLTNTNVLVSKSLESPCYCLELSTGNDYLFMGSTKSIYTVDSYTLQILDTIYGHSGRVSCINSSNHPSLFLSGSEDNKVNIWSLMDFEKIKTLENSQGKISSLQWIDEIQFFSTSKDGSLRIYNIINLEEQLTIYPITNYCINSGVLSLKKSLLFVTNDNYYASTIKSIEGVSFTDNKSHYPFEQFDLKYNRPDIVLARIGYASDTLIEAYHQAYLRRLNKMGFTEEQLSGEFHIPETKIENYEFLPTIIENEKGEIEMELNFNDSEVPLNRYNIWVNDVPLYGMTGISIINKNTKSFSTTAKVPLSNGENRIQVSCMNNAGAESYKETYYVNYAPHETKKPVLHLIAIAVSKYQSLDDLQYAEIDAKSIVERFSNSTLYSSISIDTLYGENATISNIEALKAELYTSDVDDHIIVFYSGHGLHDNTYNYYLGTTDINPLNPSEKGITYGMLEWLIDSIPARNKLLLLDACQSGEVAKELVNYRLKKDTVETQVNLSPDVNENNDIASVEEQDKGGSQHTISYLSIQQSFELMKDLFADIDKSTGAIVISAAGGLESAFESNPWGHGAFTYCLLEGLSEMAADANNNGQITISELKSYINIEVEELTNGRQKPTTRTENLVNDFVIWE
ncbi:MAG: caspase family protein [Bacteroidales bacterium]|nr:caspase family protein [Bacteroidales bacterium]